MSCKVGNQTNSQDPQAVNSRVFVGNLNTFQCSKTDVERRFQRYGRIAGISMHKGYAFIQFTNPFDARSACLGEDARLLWGQTLDVNMVAEPKSHQTGRKRQNVAKTGNDWDYYYDSLKMQLESLYDSYYAQVGFPTTPRLVVPPLKRPRIHVPPPLTSRNLHKTPNLINNQKALHPANAAATQLSELKSYSTPDILICGNCRELYSDVEQLMEHKKSYCKLRFTCKCHTRNGCTEKSLGEEPASLLCSQCKDSFHTAWDLMVHVQAAHMLNIYQLGDVTKTPLVEDTFGSSSNLDKTEGIEENGIAVVEGVANELVVNLNDIEDSHSRSANHNSQNNSLATVAASIQAVTMPTSFSHSHSPCHSLQQQQAQESNNGVAEVVAEPEADIEFDYSTCIPTSPSTISTSTPEVQVKVEVQEGKWMNGVVRNTNNPMEASTQTTPLLALSMDNPNNFDEHCHSLSGQRQTILFSL